MGKYSLSFIVVLVISKENESRSVVYKKLQEDIMKFKSQGNQVDNQTWLNIYIRFNECDREVTIHRPNFWTLPSSVFIRGDLIASTRGGPVDAH